MENFWLKVLSEYLKRGWCINGLTIPFLSGCITVPLTKDPTGFDDFFQELNSTNRLEKFTVQYCDYIGEYVVGILDEESKSIYGRQKKHIIITVGRIFDLNNEIVDIGIFLDKMKTLYNPHILKKKYSKVEGVWGGYDEKDRNRINKIFELK